MSMNLNAVASLARSKGATGAWINTLETLADPIRRTKTGTVKAWFKAHHGLKVDTIQSQPSGLFLPSGRTINANHRSGAVTLDGSVRDYAGCTVLHADESTLLISYDFNGESWAMFTLTV